MKPSKLLVTVIIPVYNEEKNINFCLKSILDQTYPSIEVIVIDDGSTDKSVQIIQEFPVQLLTKSHQGPAKSRNRGVQLSKGEILVFVDADMTFSRQFVEDLVRPIMEGKYKGTFSKEEYISNWENVWSRCWNINNNWPYKRMIPENYPDEGIDFRAILKSEFIKVGGFDDVGYTDTWTLSKKLGYKPHSVSGAVYFHANPDNLKEVFIQAKWSAKREYRFGNFGKIFALFRSLLFFSVIIGLVKSIRYFKFEFLIFKIVYDFSITIGIVETFLGGKLSK